MGFSSHKTVSEPTEDEAYMLSSESGGESRETDMEEKAGTLVTASQAENSVSAEADNTQQFTRPYELNPEFTELENFYFYMTKQEYATTEELITQVTQCGLTAKVTSKENADYIDEPTYTDIVIIRDDSDRRYHIYADYFRGSNSLYPDGIYYTDGPIIGEGGLDDYCVSYYHGSYKIANARSPYKDISYATAEEAVRAYKNGEMFS